MLDGIGCGMQPHGNAVSGSRSFRSWVSLVSDHTRQGCVISVMVSDTIGFHESAVGSDTCSDACSDACSGVGTALRLQPPGFWMGSDNEGLGVDTNVGMGVRSGVGAALQPMNTGVG